MEHLITSTSPFDTTTRLKGIIGAQVLSKKGSVVGTVKQVRINAHTLRVEGILIRRGFFSEPIYIDRTHFERLSRDAIILTVEPSPLLKGRKVITSDGQIVGKVKDIIRVSQTNEIKTVVVKPLLRSPFSIPMNSIRTLGQSVILKESYNVPKASFWK